MEPKNPAHHISLHTQMLKIKSRFTKERSTQSIIIFVPHLLGVVDRFMCCVELKASEVVPAKFYERDVFIPQRLSIIPDGQLSGLQRLHDKADITSQRLGIGRLLPTVIIPLSRSEPRRILLKSIGISIFTILYEPNTVPKT